MEANDTSSSVQHVDLDSYISVMVNIKELAERKRIRELNRRLERLWKK